MKTVLKKLNNRSGASMLMALLLLLIVAMVSSVIISAASTSAFNLGTAQDQQQAYLTAVSPAKLMRETARQGLWTYKTVTGGTVTSQNYGGPYGDFKASSTPTVTKPEDNVFFGTYIGNAVNAVLTENWTAYTEDYTIQAEGYDDVSVSLCFAPLQKDADAEEEPDKYRLQVTFSVASDVENSSSENTSPFRLTLTMDAELEKQINQVGDPVPNGTRGWRRSANLVRNLRWNATTATIEKGGMTEP